MEQPRPTQTLDYHSNVDTSRPFRSVKEAVAVFGDRILAGDLHSASRPVSTAIVLHRNPSPSPPRPRPSPSPPPSSNVNVSVESTLKKLEAELEETKVELKVLKENMSKLAAAEGGGVREEERRRDMVVTRVESLPSLAEILTSVNVGGKHKDRGYGFGENKDRAVVTKKKKPIVPLVGDLLFSWRNKRGSSTTLHNPLYSSSVYFD